MKNLSRFLLPVVIFLLAVTPVLARDCEQEFQCENSKNDEGKYAQCLEGAERCWQENISAAQSQANTLNSAIGILNGQIQVQSVKIAQTTNEIKLLEEEILELGDRIEGLSLSLNHLSGALITRVIEAYKQSRLLYKSNLFGADTFNEFLTQAHYLDLAQAQTLDLMRKAETQRLDYDNQKTLKEEKQAEVEKKQRELQNQKVQLDQQKTAKNQLLAETKNSEAIYQEKLAAAQAELAAIRGIVAGLGQEIKIRNVEAGERIASIIQGKSPCSTGTHLHFEVTQSGSRKNPFDLLKNISLIWDNADSAQNGRGDWDWPINDPIRITQGFGHTSYSQRYANDIHTGVDMVSTNSTVKSVKSGELYQGSMKCGGGALKYVRVKQSDGYDTYYLHVNY